MEYMTEIMTAISSVGFPVVMCLIMVYLMKRNEENYNKQVQLLQEAVNNNTVAVVKMCERLEAGFKNE